MRHPNVVSYLGLSLDSPLLSLVCPWMPNGTLYEYLHECPNVDKLGLVSDYFRRGRRLIV